MSDNDVDVLLITDDARLRATVGRHRPPAARLCCLTPADLPKTPLPSARQCWVDLDCGANCQLGDCRRRVYFYSRLPDEARNLPSGLFLRKPCAVPVIAILWAGVTGNASEPIVAPAQSDRPDPHLLPSWLADLHELDLKAFCHKCVEELPQRLAYADIALYLYDAQQDLLSLAEANSRRYVELAIPLHAENDHVLAAVARAGSLLITEDLVEACRGGGMSCPPDLQRAPNHAAVIAPLIADGQLQGLIQLANRCGTELSEVGPPLNPIFAFLARCLQHARQYQQARVEARIDRLTGLFNYRWMMEALSKEIQRSQRYANPLALIMIDLDGLKLVNDRFGHLAGDALLRHAAGKISAALRVIDSAARIGGDEFMVLLPATNLDGARHVAQRILTAIRTDAPVIDRKPLPVAAGLGVAQWQDHWDEDRLIKAADKAMYAAKRKGPNHLACHPHKKPAKLPEATAPRPTAVNSSNAPLSPES